MILSSVIAVLVSFLSIAALGRGDPKRLRNLAKAHHRLAQGHADAAAGTTAIQPMSRTTRRLLTALTLAPAPVLIFLGHWWALLVWAGALCTAGWITAHRLAIRS